MTSEVLAPYVEYIGSAAGALTTFAFLPQVIKVWRTRCADDLSFVTFAVFCLGVALWLVYGVLIDSPPLLVTNAITFVLALALVVMKIAFTGKKSPSTAA